jgi:hypothetical protein
LFVLKYFRGVGASFVVTLLDNNELPDSSNFNQLILTDCYTDNFGTFLRRIAFALDFLFLND